MRPTFACVCLMASLLLTPVAASAVQADEVLARSKAASGGDLWDTTRTLRGSGMLKAGGLEGALGWVVDVHGARSSGHYELGPIKGGEGYDGKQAWTQDPGGEVALLDAPEAVRRARSQAWLDARGYWFPRRMPASLGAPVRRERDGQWFDVIEATPEAGDPLSLWFAADSGLLARVDQRLERDTSITWYDDYRDVDGLRLPFHSSNDRFDATGKAEPRARSEIRLTAIERNVPVTDADFARPQVRATSRIANDLGVSRIPFDLINNHIYVDALIDGKKAHLIVDTGGANLLTPAAAKKFGLDGAGKMAARGVGDEAMDLAVANATEIRLGDVVLDKPVFYVVDLGSLPAIEGHDFDGLVGYEMFSRFGVTIDYARRELIVALPERFAAPAGASMVPFDLSDRIPIVEGSLDGLAVRLSVDTGSRVSLTLHSPFVAEHGLVARYDAAAESVMGWGVGGPARGQAARFGMLRLGDLDIKGVAGDLYTGSKGAFASPDISGNLGGGVLQRFTVAFDYAKRHMYLAPNAGFDKPDAFDRSGLFLFADGNALKIVDVAAGSAAAKAGLRIDDRILSMDGESIGRRSLDQWRVLLREQAAGSKLDVAYERAGVPATTTLVLADRIAGALESPQK